MAADAGAITPRQADVNVESILTKRAGQRDDLHRLVKCRDNLYLTDRAGHPQAGGGEASHAGEDEAGAQREPLGDALKFRSEIGPGRQAEGVHAHGRDLCHPADGE